LEVLDHGPMMALFLKSLSWSPQITHHSCS
jgi:hypothetical protein